MFNINDETLKLLLQSSCHHNNVINNLPPEDKKDWQDVVNQGNFTIEIDRIDMTKSNCYKIKTLLFRKAAEKNVLDSWIITVGRIIAQNDGTANLACLFEKRKSYRLLYFPENFMEQLKQLA